MGPPVDFAFRQSSPARNAPACHPPEGRSGLLRERRLCQPEPDDLDVRAVAGLALACLGEELGQVEHARAEPPPLDALLELAVAAGVDDDDDVEVGLGDLVEVAV